MWQDLRDRREKSFEHSSLRSRLKYEITFLFELGFREFIGFLFDSFIAWEMEKIPIFFRFDEEIGNVDGVSDEYYSICWSIWLMLRAESFVDVKVWSIFVLRLNKWDLYIPNICTKFSDLKKSSNEMINEEEKWKFS